MILDNLLTFTGSSNTVGAPPAISSGPYTDAPTTGGPLFSSNVVDLGVINGIPTSANGGGARDIGTGDDPALELSIIVTAPFAGGTSIAFALQGAPDNGAGVPGAYTTMWTTPPILLADMDLGQQLANVTVPRPAPGQVMPRFLRLQYTIVGTFTGGGSIQGQIVLDRDDQVVGTQGQYSGYPAGIVVAN